MDPMKKLILAARPIRDGMADRLSDWKPPTIEECEAVAVAYDAVQVRLVELQAKLEKGGALRKL